MARDSIRAPDADTLARVNDELLRVGLLEGMAIVVAGAADGELGAAVTRRCAGLGASVQLLDVYNLGEEAIAAATAELLAGSGSVQLLVNDGASLFARAGEGLPGLRSCLDASWNATRALANAAFLADGASGGRIVNVAPPPDAGEHAAAARAGLENLARTLSTEWARHAVVTTTIAPGGASTADDVAQLVAFLASPAGGYYSGCLFALA
jgi:NAD(P)-dependent dehydrogenase (short-subunit alcohol dehydrogenase family)